MLDVSTTFFLLFINIAKCDFPSVEQLSLLTKLFFIEWDLPECLNFAVLFDINIALRGVLCLGGVYVFVQI